MNKKQNKNKRAFTLTELLIVVIVIGVLSAVTLPKFTRVIENRKVTEAEEMMSAVRTEQERRCAMDKPYTLNFDNLSDVVSSSNTKNYTYSLQAEGVSATSNKGDYTLKMLSYQDGSFCCEGDDCTKLNKNYPSCDGLTFPSSGCEGTDGDGNGVGTDPTLSSSCSDGQVRGSQSCNTCGVQTTQACVGGRWVSQLGECSKTVAECETPECTEGAVSGSQSCNTCGTQTTQKCVSGKWVNFLGACSKTVEECTESTDCCNAGGDMGSCLLEKYGKDSAEYVCYSGTAYECGLKLFGGGSYTSICMGKTAGESAQECKKCLEQYPDLRSWKAGAYHRYACTGAPSNRCSFSSGGGESSPDDTTWSCYKMESMPPERYSYNSSLGQQNCVNKFSSGMKCPEQIKEGVFVHASHIGLTCWTSFDCPWVSVPGGPGYVGYRYVLKASSTRSTCTSDQMAKY